MGKSNKGRKIGYARVSPVDQNLTWQLIALKEYGCDLIVEEKESAKTISKRPIFENMMSELVEGDTVVVMDITRISRSTVDLIKLVNEFKELGVSFVSINDKWMDTEGPMGDFIFMIMAELAQYERALNSQRIKAGIAAVKAQGGRIGRPRKNKSTMDKAVKLYFEGNISATDIMRQTGVKRTQFYYHIREEKIKRGIN